MEDFKKHGNKNNFAEADYFSLMNKINLFLTNKKSLNSSEIDLLKSEFQLAQEIFKNIFESSENSENKDNQTKKIKSAIEQLLMIHLPAISNKIEIVFNGDESGVIDFLPFQKIIENLVKNLAAANVTDTKFRFKFGPSGLSLTNQNKLIEKKLNISGENVSLKSIAILASEMNGTFQYGAHNDTWINHIFLPYKRQTPNLKIAA
jgi:hypothetical protein